MVPTIVTPPHVEKTSAFCRAQPEMSGERENEMRITTKQASQRLFVFAWLQLAVVLLVALRRLFQSTRWTRWLSTTRPPRYLVMCDRAMQTSESNTKVDFAPCTVQKLSPVLPSNNRTRLSFYDLAFNTHDWFSTLRSDRPMELPGLLYVKPKTNHYGCPIRVIIRLNSGPGDYGVAKWLPWGLN